MIRLQVKIILWPLIILCVFSFGVQIENINSNETAAFVDFLRSQQLRHALVVRSGGGNSATLVRSYSELLANYHVQFFNLNGSVKFEELFYYGAPRTGIFMGYFPSDEHKKRVYNAASTGGFFNDTQAWFILKTGIESSITDDQLIEQELGDYNININADITVAMQRQGNTSWLLYDVYKINHRQQTPLRVNYKGEWSLKHGYKLLDTFKSSWIRRRRNMENITLRTSTALLEKPVELENMAYLANDKDLMQLDPMQRKTYQLLRNMERLYNVSLFIRFTDNWGELLPNGSWYGVMHDLIVHKADFALCPMRFVPNRQRYIQYSPELHTQFIHFLFRHPRRNNIRNIFFEPLSVTVWYCVLGLILCSMLLLLLHVHQERRLQPAKSSQNHLEVRIAFAWFTILETYLQQGPATELFQLISTRLLICASCIFSFMIMQFYGAFIVGSMLSDSPRSIVSLQTLYASSLDIGMENVSYNFVLFTNTSNRLVRDVYTKKICHAPAKNILNISEGADRIHAGGFAFHASIDRMYRLLIGLLDEQEFCQLQEIMFNAPYTSASALQKSSPWREHLAHAVLLLRETGLMQYNDKLWTVPKPDCSLIKATQVEVDLEHFAPALFALLLAMMGSGLVFLVELLFSWASPNFIILSGNNVLIIIQCQFIYEIKTKPIST
ncbi:ionotropic receptor 75a [Scaptodrosophila lebanonensis]|uniref:Ionotropic receptor 75a n=1 Tax=Drosophila lebanonensis TaxID=7225 RepID=A0A6J2TE12_DROLE|nr:ionotropic receptor 75a [Scaptodrosophila lebanonensis]